MFIRYQSEPIRSSARTTSSVPAPTDAAAVGAGTELVVLADDLIGSDWYRMNTIFKFYNQVWVLLALAGAAFVAKMAGEARLSSPDGALAVRPSEANLGIVQGGQAEPLRGVRDAVRRDPVEVPLGQRWGRTGLVVSALVVAASLLYPLLATKPRLEQRFAAELGSGTLNALDWMEYGSLPVSGMGNGERISFAGDRAAIDWLNRNVPGSPVVAEASIGPYRCNGSRISIGTGLRTIIGWERHQQQQRYPETLGPRVEDVARLYRSSDPEEKLAILRRYDVGYVVVGPLERLGLSIDQRGGCAAAPNAAGIEALERMVGSTLEVAFEAGETTVYRVLPGRPA